MSTEWAPAEVALSTRSVDQLNSLVSADRLTQLREALAGVRVALNDRVVWNVSSTPTGGGVAEILRGLLPYLSGAHERVRDEYLVTRRLLQYVDLLARLAV
jgi:hypothetical protein